MRTLHHHRGCSLLVDFMFPYFMCRPWHVLSFQRLYHRLISSSRDSCPYFFVMRCRRLFLSPLLCSWYVSWNCKATRLMFLMCTLSSASSNSRFVSRAILVHIMVFVHVLKNKTSPCGHPTLQDQSCPTVKMSTPSVLTHCKLLCRAVCRAAEHLDSRLVYRDKPSAPRTVARGSRQCT